MSESRKEVFSQITSLLQTGAANCSHPVEVLSHMVRYAFTKVGMTTAFDADGTAHGVTVLKLQPGKVLRHEKTLDGRPVIVVEYDTNKNNKTVRGWAVNESTSFEVGTDLQAPALTPGQEIKVTGFSKGRGFQDVITRHGFAGGPESHGSRFHRAPGSVGMRTQPGRTIKGKKLPGQDGDKQVTLRGIKVVYWSSEENLLAVAGGVPGARGSLVFV